MQQDVQFTSFEVGDIVQEKMWDGPDQVGLVRYAGASGDFNPIHIDMGFSQKLGLGGTIVHGMYSMAQLGRLLTDWIKPDKVKSLKVKFKGMVRPGDVLHLVAKVKRKKEVETDKILVLDLSLSVKENVCIAGEAEILCS